MALAAPPTADSVAQIAADVAESLFARLIAVAETVVADADLKMLPKRRQLREKRQNGKVSCIAKYDKRLEHNGQTRDGKDGIINIWIV